MIPRRRSPLRAVRLVPFATTRNGACLHPTQTRNCWKLVHMTSESKGCRQCGADIPAHRHSFCSDECRTYFRNHRVAQLPAICAACGAAFMARKQSIKSGQGKCCSASCATRYAKESGTFAGENSPRWIDGRSLQFSQRAPEKTAARRAVKQALRSGRMVRQPCERCGKTGRIHAHHEDYSKPLDVRWLCPIHHAEAHLEMRGIDISKRPPRKQRTATPDGLHTFRDHMAKRARTTTTRPTQKDG